jgi:hypothetical protein
MNINIIVLTILQNEDRFRFLRRLVLKKSKLLKLFRYGH